MEADYKGEGKAEEGSLEGQFLRARRSGGHRGEQHPRQSRSKAHPALPARMGSITPSGRVPRLTHGYGDEKDIDVIDQRRCKRIMALLESIHLTMDNFLYELGEFYNAIDSLEFENRAGQV